MPVWGPASSTGEAAGNFLIASAIESLGEALALTRKSGIDPHTFVDMLTATLFAAPVYKTYGGLIADERYRSAGLRPALGLKDRTLALEAARDKTVPLPVASLVRDHMMEGTAQGYEDPEDREGLREGHLWGAGVQPRGRIARRPF